MERMKRIPLLLAISLLAACSAAPSGPPGDAPSSGKASLETYEDAAHGYGIDVPGDWTIEEDASVATDDYQAVGTAFAYPAERDRSALSQAYVHIAFVSACPAQDGGVMEDVNGTPFMRTEFDGVGAGNRYRGQTFAIERGGECVVATLYTRSCNLGPDCGPDRQELYSYEDTLFKLRWTLESLRLDV